VKKESVQWSKRAYRKKGGGKEEHGKDSLKPTVSFKKRLKAARGGSRSKGGDKKNRKNRLCIR